MSLPSARIRSTPVILIVAVMASLVPAASAAPTPDLVVSSVSVGPTTTVPGGIVKVTSVLKNTGRGTAGASVIRYYLSSDQSSGGDTRIGARKAGRIEAGKSLKLPAFVALPANVALGSHFVIACADDLEKIRESNERNNCRASKAITVEEMPLPDPAPYGAPDPVDATVATAASGAVSKEISATEGGQLELTTGGSKFTLTFPAGALLSDEVITMTPVTSVAGSPLGDQPVAAVQLGPEDLVLMKPAKLRLEPATEIPVAQQGPFGADGDGSDLILYPVEPVAERLVFPIMHFSTFGLFQTDAERRSTQVQRTAANTQSEMQQRIAEAAADARLQDAVGGSDDIEEAAENLQKVSKFELRYFFDRVARPMIALARFDRTLFPKALATWIAFIRQVDLLGLDLTSVLKDVEIREIEAWLGEGFKNFVEETYDECVEKHELATIGELVSIARQVDLFGETLFRTTGVQPLELARDCATFELDFDSTMRENADDVALFFLVADWDAETRVTGHPRMSPLKTAPGTGVLEYQRYEYSGEGTLYGFGPEPLGHCENTGTRTEAGVLEFAALDLALNPRWDPDADRWDVDPAVRSVTITPSDLYEYYNSVCNTGGHTDTTEEQQQLWLWAWEEFHGDEHFEGDPETGKPSGYMLRGWTTNLGNVEVVAELEIENEYHSTESGELHQYETTTILLKHAPPPRQ